MESKTILLVEDNEDSLSIYATLLRYHGYDVFEARDGVEGVELARLHLPDLILMDLQMPRLDGWEATQQLKDDPLTAHIPVVALSVHDAYHAGVRRVDYQGYIAKPCEPRDLLNAVTDYLGASAS